MNRVEWFVKISNAEERMNYLLERFENLSNHKDEYVISKMPKYYAFLDYCINLVWKNSKNPQSIQCITDNLLRDVRRGKDLLRSELQKRYINNEWESKLFPLPGGF